MYSIFVINNCGKVRFYLDYDVFSVEYDYEHDFKLFDIFLLKKIRKEDVYKTLKHICDLFCDDSSSSTIYVASLCEDERFILDSLEQNICFCCDFWLLKEIINNNNKV